MIACLLALLAGSCACVGFLAGCCCCCHKPAPATMRVFLWERRTDEPAVAVGPVLLNLKNVFISPSSALDGMFCFPTGVVHCWQRTRLFTDHDGQCPAVATEIGLLCYGWMCPPERIFVPSKAVRRALSYFACCASPAVVVAGTVCSAWATSDMVAVRKFVSVWGSFEARIA